MLFLTSTKFPTLEPFFKIFVPGLNLANGPIDNFFQLLSSICEKAQNFYIIFNFYFLPNTT